MDEENNEQIRTIIIPNERVYIVDKSENDFWSLKQKFHDKFTENLIEAFGRVEFRPGIYIAGGTMFISLIYLNYKYAIKIINCGDILSDDERYVVLSFYDSIGLNLNILE